MLSTRLRALAQRPRDAAVALGEAAALMALSTCFIQVGRVDPPQPPLAGGDARICVVYYGWPLACLSRPARPSPYRVLDLRHASVIYARPRPLAAAADFLFWLAVAWLLRQFWRFGGPDRPKQISLARVAKAFVVISLLLSPAAIIRAARPPPRDLRTEDGVLLSDPRPRWTVSRARHAFSGEWAYTSVAFSAAPRPLAWSRVALGEDVVATILRQHALERLTLEGVRLEPPLIARIAGHASLRFVEFRNCHALRSDAPELARQGVVSINGTYAIRKGQFSLLRAAPDDDSLVDPPNSPTRMAPPTWPGR
jgi:hypothetical protein